MLKKEISVTFRTITPLWTGDAWQDNKEIRPSSLIGSLRFWFEVLMYFGGVLKIEKENNKIVNFKEGRFEKEVNRKELKNFIQKSGNNIEEIIKHLLEKQKIPISSIIFGTTNWKSLIEIKEIEPIEDYCFGNKLNLPNRICINKETSKIKENDDCPKRRNNDWSVFFFKKPYFYGKFQVKFLVEENILDSIFYLLLTFMDKYGYWGGRWNIGYGRLRVEEVKTNTLTNIKVNEIIDIDLNNFIEKSSYENFVDYETLKFFLDVESFYCKNEREFEVKTKNIPLKIKVCIFENLAGDYTTLIKNLLQYKAQLRNCLRPNSNQNNRGVWDNFRHKFCGELSEGSKILPFIDEENGNLKGGFLSIAGLLNLEKEGRNNG